MYRPDASSITAIAAVVAVVVLGLASCAQSDAVVARDAPDATTDETGPSFTPPAEDGGDAAADARKAPLLCIATECPAPYATCSSGSTVAYRCDTDLSNDENHCGACNNRCPIFAPLHMRGRCLKGACALECFSTAGSGEDFHDCNGFVDDGCEVNVNVDARNCGTCGHACAAGERCREGKCGCPAPKVDCNGRCVDLATDDANCGTCGTACSLPTDACPAGLHNAEYGCSAGQCGKLKCAVGRDCNNDLGSGCSSDGCETELNDSSNCGACGVVCAAGTECRNDGAGSKCLPICNSPACRCKPGETLCPNGACVDLLHDKFNCGGCSAACRRAGQSELVTCDKGVCVESCVAGFADCNGNPSDGCEVDLVRNPANCGTCGNRCDTGAGQPCVEGKCLMKECDAGATK